MIRRVTALLAAAILATMAIVAVQAPAVQASGTIVHGDYAGVIMNGTDVDVTTTINDLTAAHITTYAYLICGNTDSQNIWNDLPGFAAAAAAAGITVWVYLCPPTEAHDSSGTPDMKPYELDYVTWAQQIATLSNTYPNVAGYAIDDFYANLTTFTRAYVQQMVDAGRAINPAIRFLPVLYYPNIVGYSNLIGPYRYYIDGVIFPYRDDSNGTDTTNSANVVPETTAVAASLECASGPACLQFYFPPASASTAGWSTSMSQTVTVNPSATAYGLTLNVWDDFTGTTSGYRYARVLINGAAMWSQDVATATSTTAVTVSASALKTALAGKTSATLTLQMYDAKAVSNFHTAMTFDNLQATGFTIADPNFDAASNSAWTAARSSSAYLYGFVKNIAPVVMVYAAKLSSQPSPPTTAYVSAVVTDGLNLASEGLAEGTMTYVLNLSHSGTAGTCAADCYAAVAGIYGGAS